MSPHLVDDKTTTTSYSPSSLYTLPLVIRHQLQFPTNTITIIVQVQVRTQPRPVAIPSPLNTNLSVFPQPTTIHCGAVLCLLDSSDSVEKGEQPTTAPLCSLCSLRRKESHLGSLLCSRYYAKNNNNNNHNQIIIHGTLYLCRIPIQSSPAHNPIHYISAPYYHIIIMYGGNTINITVLHSISTLHSVKYAKVRRPNHHHLRIIIGLLGFVPLRLQYNSSARIVATTVYTSLSTSQYYILILSLLYTLRTHNITIAIIIIFIDTQNPQVEELLYIAVQFHQNPPIHKMAMRNFGKIKSVLNGK